MEIPGFKVGKNEYERISTPLELDLISYFHVAMEAVSELIGRSVKEGWEPEQLLAEVDMLFDGTNDRIEYQHEVAKARGVKDEPGTRRQRKNKYWYIKKPDGTWTLCFDPNKPGGRDKNNAILRRFGLSDNHGGEHAYAAPAAPAAPAAQKPTANPAGRGWGAGFEPPGIPAHEWAAMSFKEKMQKVPAGFTTKEWEVMPYIRKAMEAKEHFAAQLLAARMNRKGTSSAGAEARFKGYGAKELAKCADIFIGLDPNAPKPKAAPKPPVAKVWKPDVLKPPLAPKPEQANPPEATHHRDLLAAKVKTHRGNADRGVNQSYIAELELPDGTVKRGVLKPEIRNDDPPKNEYAAYLLDRALGINRVPAVILREYKLEGGPRAGDTVQGSWMEFAEGAETARQYRRGNQKDMEPELARVAVLDFIMGNCDRHDGNYMFYKDGTVAIIDNGRCFNRFYNKDALLSDPWRKLNKEQPFEPPADIMEKIKTVDVDALKVTMEGIGIRKFWVDCMEARINKIKVEGKVDIAWVRQGIV